MNCNIECTARKLKAIAHPLRLKLLCNLNIREMTVQELVNQTGTTQSNISQHLNHLRELGILTSRRQANYVYYRIADKQLLNVIRMMRDIYCPDNSETPIAG